MTNLSFGLRLGVPLHLGCCLSARVERFAVFSDRAWRRGFMSDSLKDDVTKAFSAPQNGIKLPAAVSTVIGEFFLNVAKIKDMGEVDTEDTDEMLAAATAGWKEANGEELPEFLCVSITKSTFGCNTRRACESPCTTWYKWTHAR